MSSGLIQRRMAAIASSRSAFSAIAAHRSLRQHHEQGQHQPGSRGLAHRASVASGPNEKRLQSPDQLHNQQHKERSQHDHPPPRSHHQQQARRPSMSQAQPQAGVADSSSGGCAEDDPQYSVLASQQVFQEATEGHREEWALAQPSPEVRLRMSVERFGNRYFVDELPCRTRKSIATAAAAGKEYITASDITRVLDTISDGEHVLSQGEAEAICAAWGDHRPRHEPHHHHHQHHHQQLRVSSEGREPHDGRGVSSTTAGAGAGVGASISTEAFLVLLGHGNK
ncbi:unnamed protein product [Ectocarpus fasciculatus]